MATKTRFCDPNKDFIGRFEGPMDPIETPKAFKGLMIRFESRTVGLIDVATSEVAVGATVLTVIVDDEDGYQRQNYCF